LNHGKPILSIVMWDGTLGSVEYYTPVARSYPGPFFEQRWREQATKEFLARC
jgi:hypothetical protein